MKKAIPSGKFRFARGAMSVILALVLTVALMVPAFASQTVTRTSPTLAYEIWDNGQLILSVSSSYIRNDWGQSGCQLHGWFDGDCTMRRLRLTFYDAYNLPNAAKALRDFNTYEGVMASSYNGSRVLRNQLSDYAARNCRGSDGIQTLINLKQYPDYKYYVETQRTVDGLLREIDSGAQAVNLRRSLSFFFPEMMLSSLTAVQLLQLSDLVVGTPEYIAFHNSLYGHDCNVVNSLRWRGYSMSYIAGAYTDLAVAAVQRIWPDYEARISAYWYRTHAW